jgi:hypothetical protein
MFQGMLAQSGIAAAGPLLNTTDIQGWHHAPWWIAGGLLIVYLFPTTQEIFHMYHPVLVEKEGLAPKSIIHIPAWKPTVLWGIALAIMTTLVLHAMAWNTTPFLYFQF